MAAKRYDFADDLLTQIKDPTSPVASTSHLLYDALGSTRSLTTEQGGLGETYAYTPFGSPLDFTLNSNTATPHLFAGEWFDAGTGYSYNRARWYDTGTGRFTATDPVEDWSNNLHLYLYASNEPVLLSDPSGKTNNLEVLISTKIVKILAILNLLIQKPYFWAGVIVFGYLFFSWAPRIEWRYRVLNDPNYKLYIEQAAARHNVPGAVVAMCLLTQMRDYGEWFPEGLGEYMGFGESHGIAQIRISREVRARFGHYIQIPEGMPKYDLNNDSEFRAFLHKTEGSAEAAAALVDYIRDTYGSNYGLPVTKEDWPDDDKMLRDISSYYDEMGKPNTLKYTAEFAVEDYEKAIEAGYSR